ncbi:MAG: calcium-binding protein [Pseudomonadota bacterium]
MSHFTHITTLQGLAQANNEGNIIDLALLESGGRIWLYAASRDGAISVWRMDDDAPGVLTDEMRAPGSTNQQNLTQIDILDGPAGIQLMTGGVFGHDLSALDLNTSTGAIGGRVALSNSQGGHLSTNLTLDGRTFLYTAERGSDEIDRYRVLSDLDLSSRGSTDVEGTVGALTSVKIDQDGILLVADSTNNSLTSHLIDASNGRTTLADTLNGEDGADFRLPTAIATATVEGEHYVILAAAGTSSLSVVALSDTGMMTMTDRVFDTLDTRFKDVQALSVVTRGTDVFILVAGSDDGISLLTLLPGGRLHPLAHMADTTQTALQNVQTLTGFAHQDGLTVLAGSGAEAGITQLTVDLREYGIVERSAPGQAVLRGSAEDDILIAGDGGVRLEGRAGADTFVFDPAFATNDGALGRINDYTPGEDRIDLSTVLALHDLERVTLQQGNTGATIEIGPYSIEVFAAPGETLSLDDFERAQLQLSDRPTFDPENHPAFLNAEPEPDPDPDPDTGVTLNGTSARDILFGTDGDDFIFGKAGNDQIEGGAGNDMLDGGDNGDIVIGGNGNDTMEGGEGNDELLGGSGNDVIAGGAGADVIIGNSGNDVMTGSGLSDLVFGGPGDDFVNGGWGFDRINGGPGADRFFHLGIADHGSDWVQDYTAADWDVLFFGNRAASASDFRVSLVETPNAGQAGVEEAFIVYVPTGQIMWALIDGAAQEEINLLIAGQSEVFDLFG